MSWFAILLHATNDGSSLSFYSKCRRFPGLLLARHLHSPLTISANVDANRNQHVSASQREPAMNIKSWSDFARDLALYARFKLGTTNRGALLIRRTSDGAVVAGVFG